MAPPGTTKVKTAAAPSETPKKQTKPRDDFEEAFYSDVSSGDNVEDSDLPVGALSSKRKRTNQAQVAHARAIKKARKTARENELASTTSTLSDQDDDPEEESTSLHQGSTKRTPVRRRAFLFSPIDTESHSSNTSLFSLDTAGTKTEQQTMGPHTSPPDSGKTFVRFNMSELHHQARRLGIASTADVIGEIAPDGKLEVVDCANQDGTIATVTIPRLDCMPDVVLHKIYRRLFVSDLPVSFDGRVDLSRSSALLRVCRKFHDEGTQVLYGENAFHLQRKHATRGKYWESEWKEIGYKDVRRFLEEIGMLNVTQLKYVSIELDDATPGISASLTEFQRRFVNDAVLLHVLRTLGENCLLEKFAICVNNRKTIDTNDYLFLKRLSSVKCHEFSCHSGHGRVKVSDGIEDKLRTLMEVPRAEDVDVSKKKAPKMMHEKPRS